MSKEPPYLKNPINAEDKEKIKKVFSQVTKDPYAYDFLEPVDYVGLGLTEYPTIIKKPMDLGTVQKNLENNEYETFKEFLEDVDLIWTNCRTFNMPGSEICKFANHCEKLFKKQMEKQFKSYSANKNNSNSNANNSHNNTQSKQNDDINNDNSITNEQKMNLTEKIRILNNDGLTQVVKLIMKECPKGIEDIDSEKLQIKIDFIDSKTYGLLIDCIEKSLKNNENKSADNSDKKD